MDNTRITMEWLEGLGFKDLTGGWGGSSGNGYLMHLRRGVIDVAVGTVDFTPYWVLHEHTGYGWMHAYPVVKFTSINALNDWCITKFGERLFS